MATCRVVLAEDNLLVRAGVQALLDLESDIEVAATASSLPELLERVAIHAPDVVVTDVRMPPSGTDEGIRAAVELRATHPEIGVIVLSQYVDPTYLMRLIEGGSSRRGYLLKEHVASPGELVSTIRLVHGGGSFIDPTVVDSLVSSRSAGSPLGRLTEREREIMAEVATGKSNAAIAAAVFVGERAVEKHINSIFSKLGLFDAPDSNRRVQAVLLFLQQGGS